MRIRNQVAVRKGAIAPMAGFLIIFMVGMVAFAVDVSWMVATETELVNTADAAALAAAGSMPDYFVQYYLPNVTQSQKDTVLTNALSAARTAANTCAGYNGAGGMSSLKVLDADVVFGYMDSNLNYSSTYTAFPNTVTVTVRRDS